MKKIFKLEVAVAAVAFPSRSRHPARLRHPASYGHRPV